VAEFGRFLFTVGSVVLCMLIASWWLLSSNGSRAARRFVVIAAFVYWAASAYAVPAAITRLLAFGYTPLTADIVPAGRVGIVLLGSGAFQEVDWSGNRFTVVDRIGAARLAEAARLYHLLQPAFVISSGGQVRPTPRTWPPGSTMAEGLVRLGVPRERILVEDDSPNTRAEALIVKRMLGEHPVDHLVLVTSRIHMRRSVGVFRAVGLPVVPAIAHQTPPYDTWLGWLAPTDKGLEESARAAHELAGLVVYAARGWYR
jgi:uncharacterized SAM-binding protein YcdF (DUF218 family)